MDKLRLLVNAIPLKNVNTGISRYLREIYTRLESNCNNRLEIRYFDGNRVARTMPPPPEDTAGLSLLASAFWKLPPRIAFAVRILRHNIYQRHFNKFAADADVYHEPAFFPFKTPPGVRTVFTVHDMSTARHPEFHPQERVLYFNRYFRDSLSRVDEFITVSEFTKNELTALTEVAPEKVTAVPLAHSPETFSPRPSDYIHEVIQKYHLPEKYFLFVGGGDPRKNLRASVQALSHSGLTAGLAVTGWSGWAKDEEALPGVLRLGHISDDHLAALYTGARALIFPSEYEGFGLPILEAMACGCPVVAARRASLPEVADDAALLVNNPHDQTEFANALIEIDTNTALRKNKIEKGMSRCGNFSWDKTAAATLDVIEKSLQ